MEIMKIGIILLVFEALPDKYARKL